MPRVRNNDKPLVKMPYYDIGVNARFNPTLLRQPPLPTELTSELDPRAKHGFIEQYMHQSLGGVAKLIGADVRDWTQDPAVAQKPYWWAWWDWYKHHPDEFFRDCLFVITKDGAMIPLDINHPKFSRAQKRYLGRLLMQLMRLGYIRGVVLKARQMGSTTLSNALCFHGTIFNPNQRHITLADEGAKAKFITRYVRDWILHESGRGVPAWLKPQLDYKATDHLRFNDFASIPIQSMSEYFVADADEAAGRAFGIRSVLGTEVAYWGKKGQEAMLGIKNTVARSPNTLVMWESTAYGFGGAFHGECEAAQKGGSNYEFIFIPWYLIDDYRFDATSPEVYESFGYGDRELAFWEDAFRCRRFDLPQLLLDEEEKKLVSLEKDALDHWQILWRRWAIKNLCGNDLDKFHQEYPSTPKEAFLGSGQPVFWQAFLIQELERCEKEAEGVKGYLVEAR